LLEPFEVLQRLCNFIVLSYVPMWFTIKQNWKIHHGAQNFLKMLLVSDACLTEGEKALVFPVLRQGAYYTHIENVLICMMADENLETRMKAFDIVRNIRVKRMGYEEITTRIFKTPNITCMERNMDDLLKSNEMLCQPPLLRLIHLKEIRQLVLDGPLTWDYPCHSQNVERLVQSFTKASALVSGEKRRDGVIRSQLLSREEMPAFTSKKAFNV
jgi:hypothetical protein